MAKGHYLIESTSGRTVKMRDGYDKTGEVKRLEPGKPVKFANLPRGIGTGTPGLKVDAVDGGGPTFDDYKRAKRAKLQAARAEAAEKLAVDAEKAVEEAKAEAEARDAGDPAPKPAARKKAKKRTRAKKA